MGFAKKILFGLAAFLLLAILIAGLGGEKAGRGHPAVIAQVETSLRALPFTTEMFGAGFKAREITTVNERGAGQCANRASARRPWGLSASLFATR